MDYFGSMTWDSEAMLFIPWKWLLLNGIPKVRKETWHHQGAAVPEVVKKKKKKNFKKLLCSKVHEFWLSSQLRDKINTRNWGRNSVSGKETGIVSSEISVWTFVKILHNKIYCVFFFPFCKENKWYHFLLTYKINWEVQFLPTELSAKAQNT